MKKILLGICLSAMWLSACQKGDAIVQPDEQIAGVPAVVVQAIKSEYPSATEIKFSTVEKETVWESSFQYQTQAHEAKIDNKGQILEVYSVAGGVTLPTAIQDYIAKNYAGYRIVVASEGKSGTQKSFKVLLKNEKEEITLLFDETGKLLAEFKATPPAAGITPPKSYPIQKVEELPAVAAQYIKDQGLTFGRGIVVVEKDGKKTFTVTATKGTTIFTLVFDEAGKLLKSNSFIPPPAPQIVTKITELPAAIVAALQGYTFVKGTITTDRDGKKTYYIAATKEGRMFEMVFDTNGKLIKSSGTPPTPQRIQKVTDLPAAIGTALQGYVFESGLITFDRNEKKTYTIIAAKDGKRYELIFDNDGKLVKNTLIPSPPKVEQKAVVATDLPQAIKDYLNKNYVGWQLEKGQLTTINGERSEYLLYLKVGTEKWWVVFDGKGNFKSARKG